MHICCSNCSLYPLQDLMHKGIDVKGFWYNPNIHPLPEYEQRLASLTRLKDLWGLDIEYIDEYGEDNFIREIGDPDNNRCSRCYAMRLEETAKAAKKMGLDGFTTSMLVSPYQKYDMITDIGEAIGKKHSIPFFAKDFREGYRGSIGLSRDLGLYRQKYCACLYSKAEREEGKERGQGVKDSRGQEKSEKANSRGQG